MRKHPLNILMRTTVAVTALIAVGQSFFGKKEVGPIDPVNIDQNRVALIEAAAKRIANEMPGSVVEIKVTDIKKHDPKNEFFTQAKSNDGLEIAKDNKVKPEVSQEMQKILDKLGFSQFYFFWISCHN